MFGGRRNNNDRGGESLSSVVTPENPPKAKGGNVTGFDPEGLERAAKAARELDASRNASAAIELIKTQEVTKQVNSPHFFLVLDFFFPVGGGKDSIMASHDTACRQPKEANGMTIVYPKNENFTHHQVLIFVVVAFCCFLPTLSSP